MVSHGKIGRYRELISEVFQYAVGLRVIIVDEITGKDDKGWEWIEATDLGNSAAECLIRTPDSLGKNGQTT